MVHTNDTDGIMFFVGFQHLGIPHLICLVIAFFTLRGEHILEGKTFRLSISGSTDIRKQAISLIMAEVKGNFNRVFDILYRHNAAESQCITVHISSIQFYLTV